MVTLKIRDLWFKYGSGWVLRGINLELDRGINCIVGKNGSGKTTLLRVIINALKPQRGSIILGNTKIKSMKQASKYMIYVPSNAANFFIGPTVRDELDNITNIPKNVEMLIDKKILELSEGQKRIVALTIALSSEKPVVILDEPTVGLDKKHIELFFELARKVSNRKIIIITTNEPKILFKCDKIIVLDNGYAYSTENPIDAIRIMPYDTPLKRLIRNLERKGVRINSIEDIRLAVKNYA